MGALHSGFLFPVSDTPGGPEPKLYCDGVYRPFYWNNQTGRIIYLKGLRLWFGADVGMRGDIQGSVYLNNGEPGDPKSLLLASWDHYAEPTDPNHQISVSFAPDYFRMVPGGWITLLTRGVDLNNRKDLTVLLNLLIYYSFTTT